VHFDDLPRLDNDTCLNDSLIDFYMMYVRLCARSIQPLTKCSFLSKKLDVPADKVYFFNSFFFSRLTENSGRKTMDYKAVERWTSKIDVFSYDYIVIPINEQ
jgi:sentrin-specific protease 7